MKFIAAAWGALAILNSLVAAAAEPIAVTVAPLAELVEYPSHSEPAHVISTNDSQLSSEVTARIVSIPVEVGQVVEANTPLIKLDGADLALGLARAKAILRSLQARYQLAQRQLERAQALAKQRSLSEEELHQREINVQISRAEIAAQQVTIAQTRRHLDKTVIRAPFKAIVMDRLAHEGELAMPATPLLRIMDVEGIELTAKLPPQRVMSLKSTQDVQFVTQNASYPVEVHRVTPALDVRERSQEVRLRFTGEPPLIGSTGHVSWRQDEPHVPADLLVRRGNALGIFVADQNHANFIPLADASEGQPVQINLPEDTSVIVNGRFVVADGDPVTVANP